ncbi:lipolytic protein G-D-S-L family [[Leptolyngbya] sp. PCC 7376]|uniref:GDSL-type esterase/lipase family protein n=1 Tax=[Leptolyngbya] sp. PCC 7376 TaxID=111781 RepID=UPI00029EC7E8|nr:GDSL-type esterase/lipase family protein [[Leptolyngbya] sp. PCC 7376]AFY37990.1 lipolytic protein G-D-S-L family [[Leptolyngbya] sp. PCC 7376]
MSEPLLLAASLLSGETTVGAAPQTKPITDPWQMVDQMGLLDQQRVQGYQQRSQPLAQRASVTQPEVSSKYSSQIKGSSPQAFTKVAQPSTPKRNPVAYQRYSSNPANNTPQTFTVKSTSVRPIQSTTNQNPWPSTSNTNTSRRPSSNPQLFSQRVNALKAGQLYTRLKGNSFETAWAGARQQPTHQEWQNLLQQEAKSVATGQGNNRLGVLVGDSLSMWFPSDLLPEGKLWLNQGISGENTSQVLQRLNALDRVRPETIYVMAGVNDLKQGASDATVLNNTRAIIRRLRYQHPYATIVLQSLLPTRMAYLSPDRAIRLNNKLQAIAGEENAGYLNLHALFVDQEGKMRQDLSTDGLHLNRQGYKVWQQAMQQAEKWVAKAS